MQAITAVACSTCHGLCEYVHSKIRVPSPKRIKAWDEFWSKYRAEKSLLDAFHRGELRHDVTLELLNVPLLDGAKEMVAAGIFSSLQPQNVRLRRAVRNLDEASADVAFPLLFDPQTAGGLLVAVPQAQAADCVARLKQSGYLHATVIGQVTPRSNDLESITIAVARNI